MSRLLILGFGYTAARFHQLYAQDWNVAATARRDEAAQQLHALGVEAVRIDSGFAAPFAEALHGADALLITAGPEANGDPFVAAVEADLSSGAGRPAIVYLSTIGVYGDHQGGVVDEETPVAPGAPRSVVRVAAEHAWQALGKRIGAPVAILRLPGIYGPGRSVLDQLRAGQARRIIKPGQVFNRVHVDDIAQAIAAAIRLGADGIFNIVDDDPGPPQDVVVHGAALLGMPPPPEVAFEAASLSPMARSFYAECKRVQNTKAKAVLGWRPRYPTYREGLAAILPAGG